MHRSHHDAIGFEIKDESFIAGRVLVHDFSLTREPSRILTTKLLAFNSELVKRFHSRLWTVCPPSVSLSQWKDDKNNRVLHGSSINLFESPSACSPDDGWSMVMFLLELTAVPAFQDVVCVLYDNDGDFIEPLVVNLEQDENSDLEADSDEEEEDDNESSTTTTHQVPLYTYIQGGQVHYVPNGGFRNCYTLLQLARNPFAFLAGICNNRLNKRLESLKSGLISSGDVAVVIEKASCSRFFGFSMVKVTLTRDVAHLFQMVPHLVPMAVHAVLSVHEGSRSGNKASPLVEHFLNMNGGKTSCIKIALGIEATSSEGILTEIPIPNIQLARLLAAENQNRLPSQFLLRQWGFPTFDADNTKDSYREDQIIDSRLIGSKVSCGLYKLCHDPTMLSRLDAQFLAPISLEYLKLIDESVKDWVVQNSSIEQFTPLSELVENEIHRLIDPAYIKIMAFEGLNCIETLMSQFRTYITPVMIFRRLKLLMDNSQDNFSRLSDPVVLSTTGSYCWNRPSLFTILLNLIHNDSKNGLSSMNIINKEACFSSELNLTANDTDMRNILDVISGGEGKDLVRILGLGDNSNIDIPNFAKWEEYYANKDDIKAKDSENSDDEVEDLMKAFQDLSLGKLIRSEIKRDVINSTSDNDEEEGLDSDDEAAQQAEERDFLSKLNVDVRADLTRPKAEMWEQGISGSLIAERNVDEICPTRLVADDIRRQYE